MTAKTTRILKEARPLFWPWCAVAIAGVPHLIHPFDWALDIWAIGWFFGIPLLATLSFGDEFQHRTLSLLLSQPVGRMVIWGEKLSVTVVAIVSAGLVFSLPWRAAAFNPARQILAFAGAWIIATTASAAFWTLFTRSTVGGVALNIGIHAFISIAVPWANLAHWLRARGYRAPGNPIVPLTITSVFLCYVGVMLWLGRRALARFQATGGMGSDDLLMAGPGLMPGALAGWFRCRPKGAVLNLIRKEFRLLRPVWLISLLAALGWFCLTLYGLVHERGSTGTFTSRVPSVLWPDVVWIVGVPSTLIIAMLAGVLSLGEERTSGTHAWHLTLPVSALPQWLIKLSMALFAGLLGAVLLPLLLLTVVGSLSGLPFKFVDVDFGIFWVVMVALLTFASFWCACAVKGTVRAVLWVFPVLIAVDLASVSGAWAGRELVHAFVARFDPFASFRFTTAVSRLGSNVFFRLIDAASENMTDSVQAGRILATTIFAPTLLLAVIQSYRLFRAPLQDRKLAVVRSLLPLAMTAFLCNFSSLASYTFMNYARADRNTLLFGTQLAVGEILRARAIAKVLPGSVHPDATHPLQLTGDDVAKAYPFHSPLPEMTRRLLRNARITVTPDKAHPGGFVCSQEPPGPAWCYYSATIHLADGTDITESFEPRDAKFPFGGFSIYAHWPGAEGQESLLPW